MMAQASAWRWLSLIALGALAVICTTTLLVTGVEAEVQDEAPVSEKRMVVVEPGLANAIMLEEVIDDPRLFQIDLSGARIYVFLPDWVTFNIQPDGSAMWQWVKTGDTEKVHYDQVVYDDIHRLGLAVMQEEEGSHPSPYPGRGEREIFKLTFHPTNAEVSRNYQRPSGTTWSLGVQALETYIQKLKADLAKKLKEGSGDAGVF